MRWYFGEIKDALNGLYGLRREIWRDFCDLWHYGGACLLWFVWIIFAFISLPAVPFIRLYFKRRDAR